LETRLCDLRQAIEQAHALGGVFPVPSTMTGGSADQCRLTPNYSLQLEDSRHGGGPAAVVHRYYVQDLQRMHAVRVATGRTLSLSPSPPAALASEAGRPVSVSGSSDVADGSDLMRITLYLAPPRRPWEGEAGAGAVHSVKPSPVSTPLVFISSHNLVKVSLGPRSPDSNGQ
jgi:hypothetical protein